MGRNQLTSIASKVDFGNEGDFSLLIGVYIL